MEAQRLPEAPRPNQERLRKGLESAGYMPWLYTLFPRSFTRKAGDGAIEVLPFAEFHHEHWRWFWDIRRGLRPHPLVEVLPRGSGKSTGTELGVISCGCRNTRRYVLYISRTQDKADDHVLNIAQKLESKRLERFYPEMTNRLIGKFGSSRGWRRNRVRTKTGFTIDALGIDAASRGAKVEDQRPDLIVLDDIDATHDSDRDVRRLIQTLTRDILPTGSDDCAVIFAQNKVHDRSVAALLCGLHPQPELFEDLTFLLDRQIIGPVRALEGFKYEQQKGERGVRFTITAGTPTWPGMDLPRCQDIINNEGLSSFLTERQHETKPPKGGIFSHLDFDVLLVDPSEVPAIVRSVVAVDPAVTATDDSDACGIQLDSMGADDKIYRQFSWEQRATPEEAMSLAFRKGIQYGADTLVVETDQGGDTWESVFEKVWTDIYAECQGSEDYPDKYPGHEEAECPFIVHITPETLRPRFVGVKAGSTQQPKTHRASQMLVDYEKVDRFRHVRGTHSILHAALDRFPKTKPLDLVDASYWAWDELVNPSNFPTLLLHGGARIQSPYR